MHHSEDSRGQHMTTTTATPSLPPGWQHAFTPEGRLFYINHHLKRTTFSHPHLRYTLLQHLGHDLPLDWEVDVDQDGLVFFIDHEHQTTQRLPPWPLSNKAARRRFNSWRKAVSQSCAAIGGGSSSKDPPLTRVNIPTTISATASPAYPATATAAAAAASTSTSPSKGDWDQGHSQKLPEGDSGNGSPTSPETLGGPFLRAAPTLAASPTTTLSPPLRGRGEQPGDSASVSPAQGGGAQFSSWPPHPAWLELATGDASCIRERPPSPASSDHGYAQSYQSSSSSSDTHSEASLEASLNSSVSLCGGDEGCGRGELPAGWESHTTAAGVRYYTHAPTHKSTWCHPGLAYSYGIDLSSLPSHLDVDCDEEGVFVVNHDLKRASRDLNSLPPQCLLWNYLEEVNEWDVDADGNRCNQQYVRRQDRGQLRRTEHDDGEEDGAEENENVEEGASFFEGESEDAEDWEVDLHDETGATTTTRGGRRRHLYYSAALDGCESLWQRPGKEDGTDIGDTREDLDSSSLSCASTSYFRSSASASPHASPRSYIMRHRSKMPAGPENAAQLQLQQPAVRGSIPSHQLRSASPVVLDMENMHHQSSTTSAVATTVPPTKHAEKENSQSSLFSRLFLTAKSLASFCCPTTDAAPTADSPHDNLQYPLPGSSSSSSSFSASLNAPANSRGRDFGADPYLAACEASEVEPLSAILVEEPGQDYTSNESFDDRDSLASVPLRDEDLV